MVVAGKHERGQTRGTGGDERDGELIEVPNLCLQEHRHATPVPAPGNDWRSRVRRPAGRAGPGQWPPEGHDDRNATRAASQARTGRLAHQPGPLCRQPRRCNASWSVLT